MERSHTIDVAIRFGDGRSVEDHALQRIAVRALEHGDFVVLAVAQFAVHFVRDILTRIEQDARFAGRAAPFFAFIARLLSA